MKIGIDVGGSHIGIGLIQNDRILEKIEKEVNSKETEESILHYIDDKIEELVKQEKQIEKIGIATPGYIEGNCMKNLVNLGISQLDFSMLIEKYNNIPFQIKNDSKMAGLAEKKYGTLKEYENAVFICLGTGIGSGVFLNGNLLQTQQNLGFELGHMILQKDGIKCNCGKYGCFETYCSMKRLKEKIKETLETKEISSRELVQKMQEKKDDPKVKAIIDEFIMNLIIGFSNIIDLFVPEAICIGGSFIYFKDIFWEKLQREFATKKYAFYQNKMPKLVLAELGNDAGMIGAVIE